MRVLHIIGGLGPGGAEALLYRLVRSNSNVEHQIVCLGDRDWYSSLLEAENITLHHLGVRSGRSTLTAAFQLFRLIRQSRADVVQTWLYRSNLVGGIFSRLAGVPVVWGIHNASFEPLGFWSRVQIRISGVLVRLVPNFIVNCSRRSADIHSTIGYGRAPGAVIHNGYESTVFRPDDRSRMRVRETLGIGKDVFVAGCITRWISYKDVPTLLRAVRICADRKVPLACLLIGNGLGSDNQELMQQIHVHGCGELVVPLGVRSDVPDLARAMDVHVLPSLTEAFPNVVAETMLSGAPNVVTDVGDSSLIVGETGWVVPPRSPYDLADSIVEAWREWEENPSAWNNRRSVARSRIVENFSFDRMAAAYEEVWRRLAKGRG